MLNYLYNLDVLLTQKIVIRDAVQNPIVRLLFLIVEWMAHGIPWLLISGLGTLYSINRRQSPYKQWKWTVLLFGILLDLATIGITKLIFRRSRPPYNADDQIYEAPIADKYSFPSGHSSRAAMLMILGITFYESKYLFHFIIFPLFLGFTRIAMGRHYFFDVIAGLALGVLQGLIALQLPNYIPNMISEYFPIIFIFNNDNRINHYHQ